MIHKVAIHHFKRVVIILKPVQAEVAPLCSHSAHTYPFALAFILGWEWRWGGQISNCAVVPS